MEGERSDGEGRERGVGGERSDGEGRERGVGGRQRGVEGERSDSREGVVREG